MKSRENAEELAELTADLSSSEIQDIMRKLTASSLEHCFMNIPLDEAEYVNKFFINIFFYRYMDPSKMKKALNH